MTFSKPTLEIGKFDLALILLSIAALVVLWRYIFMVYHDLPQTIPTHFGSGGKADGFGHKKSIFQLPLVATILSVGLLILAQFPYLFNFPHKITRKNIARQYKLAQRLLRFYSLIVIFIFSKLSFDTIKVARDSNPELSRGAILWESLYLLFLIIVYLILASKEPSSRNG